MSSGSYIELVLVILMLTASNCGGNSSETFTGRVEGGNICCGSQNGSQVQIQGRRFRPLGQNGGKYRIPITSNMKLSKSTSSTVDDRRLGELHRKRLDLSVKIGNETNFRYKRQKIFFRKNFSVEGKGGKDRDKKTIYLLGLFDLTRPKKGAGNLKLKERYEERKEGKSEMWAANLAMSHVNKRQLVGGYRLEMYWNDTKMIPFIEIVSKILIHLQCDPGVAVDALFHALFSKNTPLPILLGPACSMAIANLASITPYWNIIQISFGATSPILSNREKFSTFYRVAAPDSSHNAAKMAFIRHFGWNTVTFISQNEKEYILAVNYFIKVLEGNNVTCKETVTFGENDFEDQLQRVKDLDTRIIFGSFSEEMAPKIFCKVHELGVYGSNYAWILQGTFDRKWWKTSLECSRKKLKRAVQGVFFISSYHDPDQSHPFHTNFSSRDLKRELSKSKIPMSRYARESYDAIWTAAIALNESLRKWSQSNDGTRIEDFNYDRYDMAETIFYKISQINSSGMSGPISFEGADRLGASVFYQLQGEDLNTVAIYLPTTKFLNFTCAKCRKVFWEGGQVPVSQRFLLKRIETISLKAFLVVACSTFLAILLAISFLTFNSYFRKLKNIKLSSPKLNNIAVAGCIAVYIGVFLLGLDYGTLPNGSYYSFVCTAKVYFFSAGFSLAFGAIFAKTYRVHNIFIKSQGGFIRKKFLQDRQLILLIGVLLLIDGLILTIWVVVDPLERKLHNATIEYSTTNRSVMYQTQIEICSCNHLNGWLSFLYMYKGLQLLMGVFLAWETRHVKIPGLNDSQYIVLSVYTVVITSCIVVALANLIFERPTIAYLIISAMILSSTTATLFLLFFPKIKIIFSKSSEDFDPVMQSMGLILESNTRRFLTNDAKEKLYRIEVQNRVYKREAFTLGNEISRLEKELATSPSQSNQNFKIGDTVDYQIYTSLQEISTITDYRKQELLFRFLTRSWPSEIHKIPQWNRRSSFQSTSEEDMSKKHSIGKYWVGKEKMRNILKNTIQPSKKKDQEQRKFVLSQYLPYVQKTVEFAESNEDVNIWRMDKAKMDEKGKLGRKCQTRFKGSPRFPHRIVPSDILLERLEKSGKSALRKDSKTSEEVYSDDENVFVHEVEVLVASKREEQY